MVTKVKSDTITRREVAKALKAFRATAKVKVDEALVDKSEDYREAFWRGFDIARELGRNELDWIFEKAGIDND
ncbi:MAG: hypothetical protein JW967_04615 [Dehalococcoidales bacterium]|nr:hypothetical protein [Dehalococcoidales bacterium]